MAGNSKIEWTERTWNPIVGCSIVSPGCTNCYAMKMAGRIQKMNRTGASGSDYVNHYDGTTRSVNGHVVWAGKLAQAPREIFNAPLSRKKPTTWFVNSMGDLFHEDVPDEWIDRVFAVMALTPQHTYQVLTKRAQRMSRYFGRHRWHLWAAIGRAMDPSRWAALPDIMGGDRAPLPNVWLGVSTERQQEANERVPLLIDTPAAKRFVSAEPLLGHLALHALNLATETPSNALRGVRRVPNDHEELTEPTAKLDWVIVGGESGPKARPMHPEWARDLRDQCAAADVPFFFKQFGEWLPWSQFTGAGIEDDPEQTRFATREWDGEHWLDIGRPMWCDTADGSIDDEQCVGRVGKARAGRLLDGVEHNEFPTRGDGHGV